jgi:hypothetical protein
MATATKIVRSHGSNTVIRKVQVDGAFVQNDSVEVEIEQPAGSLISKAYIRSVAQPTVTASMDLGFKVGTQSGGTEIYNDADGIIDAAGNTTAFKTNGFCALPVTAATAAGSNTAIAALTEYSADERTLFCNTTATNSAISDAGKVEWIFFFEILGEPQV